MRKSLASVIPEYMIPSAFVCLDAIPKHRMERPTACDSLVRLTSGRHWTLSTLHRAPYWKRTLREFGPKSWRSTTVGVHDNFFDLGGDSLLATKVAVRVLKELKVEVPLKTLFQCADDRPVGMKIGEKRAGTSPMGS